MLNVREIHIKTMMRTTLHLSEWLKSTTQGTLLLVRMWRKGSPPACWCECKLVGTLWRSLTKFKIELPCDPAVSLRGTYPKGAKTQNQRSTGTPKLTAALPTLERAQMSINDQWIKKMCCRYQGLYSAIKIMESCHLQQGRWSWRVSY